MEFRCRLARIAFEQWGLGKGDTFRPTAPGAAGRQSLVLIGLWARANPPSGGGSRLRSDLPFADADQEIEIAAGKTINEIFAENGEAYFRDGERRVIARLLEDGCKVLATGGGAFMNAETRERIAASGVSVWLKADLDLLMQPRHRAAITARCCAPPIRARSWKADRRALSRLCQADITVAAEMLRMRSIVDEIIAAVETLPEMLPPALNGASPSLKEPNPHADAEPPRSAVADRYRRRSAAAAMTSPSARA